MKNRFIQLITIFLTVALCINFRSSVANAASFSVSSSKISVTPGQSFSVTVSVAGAGQFSVSASNGSVSASSIWVDGSSSFTVTAGSAGTTTVNVTAVDVTANDESAVTGTRSVSVKVSAPSTPNNTTPTKPTTPGNNTTTGGNSGEQTTPQPQEVDTRSSENTLSSLTISKGSLSPAFSEGTTSYSVELTSDVTTFSIDAKAKDAKASVSGIEEKSLALGDQTFGITVVAENGAKKVYSITVHVSEKPTVFTKLGDEELGLLIDVSDAKIPDGYQSQTVKLEGQDITGWTNDKMGLTLVYLMDKENQKNLYIYEDGKVVRQYETIDVNGKTYVLLNIPDDMKDQKGLVFGKVKLGELELDGWTFKDENHKAYCVVYLLNSNGEKTLYVYEQTEGTLQKYVAYDEAKTDSTLTYIFIGTTVLFAMTTAVSLMMHLQFKKKSIASIKEYYEKKNKDLGE